MKKARGFCVIAEAMAMQVRLKINENPFEDGDGNLGVMIIEMFVR